MEILNEVEYKEFILISTPLELVEKQGWVPRVIIRFDKSGCLIKEKPLEFTNIFSNREEAIQYGFGMAQKYIDDGQAKDLLE